MNGTLTKAAGAHPDISSWYVYFITNIALRHPVAISYLVAHGEVLVGAALIIGAFTGIAAFFSAFMNISYLFAGTVSVNLLLVLLQIFLIRAWRNAGAIGVDRYLLPHLGVPWQPGKAFGKSEPRTG